MERWTDGEMRILEKHYKKNPAKFYMNSVPAHVSYPSRVITYEQANHVHAGSAAESNDRTINQYIHPDILETARHAYILLRSTFDGQFFSFYEDNIFLFYPFLYKYPLAHFYSMSKGSSIK